MKGDIHKIEIDLEIYKYHVIIVLHNNPDKLKNYLEKDLNMEFASYNDDLYISACYNYTTRSTSLIEINVDRLTTLGTVIHEMLHATTNCLESRGVIISEKNDEAMCYVLAFIMNKAMEDKLFSEYISKIKKKDKQ